MLGLYSSILCYVPFLPQASIPPPPTVDPVVFEDVKFTPLLDGVLLLSDNKTNAEIKRVTLFTPVFDESLELDVQHSFPCEIRLDQQQRTIKVEYPGRQHFLYHIDAETVTKLEVPRPPGIYPSDEE